MRNIFLFFGKFPENFQKFSGKFPKKYFSGKTTSPDARTRHWKMLKRYCQAVHSRSGSGNREGLATNSGHFNRRYAAGWLVAASTHQQYGWIVTYTTTQCHEVVCILMARDLRQFFCLNGRTTSTSQTRTIQVSETNSGFYGWKMWLYRRYQASKKPSTWPQIDPE